MPVTCEMSCGRLLLVPPPGVFFSSGMYQTPPWGFAVARLEREEEGKESLVNSVSVHTAASWNDALNYSHIYC